MKRLLAALILFPTLAGAEPWPILDAPRSTPLDWSLRGVETPSPDAELQVRGVNPHAQPVTVVLRLDDSRSHHYASRFNSERVLPPGPFVLRWPLSGLRRSDGRPLALDELRRLILFVADGQPQLRLDTVGLYRPPAWPSGTVALDLGAADSPLQSGFERLTADDLRLQGGRVQALRRRSEDALLGDGLRGIAHLHLTLAPGRWRLRLWLDDLGEWELLPHPLQREVWADGRLLWAQQLDADRWLREVWLRGREEEALEASEFWTQIGSRRGGPQDFEVEVGAARLDLELRGVGSDARYLAAVLAWPAQGADAGAQLDALRREQFLQTWRSLPPPLPPPVQEPVLAAIAPGDDWLTGADAGAPVQQAAPGSSLTFEWRAQVPRDEPQPLLVLRPPHGPGGDLPAELRFGHWRLQRPQAAATLLAAGADHLRADLAALQLQAGLPRRLVVRLRIPSNAAPGSYVGGLQLYAGGRLLRRALKVEVLPVQLPPAPRPVGFYLEPPAWLDWFPELGGQRADWLRCDLQRLRAEGLSTVAPGLSTPGDAAGRQALLGELAELDAVGYAAPLLAYAPLKRLRAALGDEASAVKLEALRADLQRLALPEPLWALADEPHAEQLDDLREQAHALHARLPGLRLAGQLNHPRQRPLLEALQVALVNAGYGADRADIDALHAAGVEAWLYNLGHERIAAGFYLWRSGADGLLQWHARLPTAAPFDPTDGREADFQMFYPALQPCASPVDVDARLYALADGLLDLRWLAWLDAQPQPQARALRQSLWDTVPSRWNEARQLPATQLGAWRTRILELAKDLHEAE